MQQTRLSWTLAALVLASAVLTSLANETALTASSNSTLTAISSTSSDVCAAASCRLSNGATCNRTVAGCPVCITFQAATNEYTCTTVVKATKLCAQGYSTCESASVVTPSPSPSSAGVKVSSMSSSAGDVLSSRSDSGELRIASVRTEAPETTVTSTSTEKNSSFPVWIVIGAGIVVGCILAAVGGTMYARRRQHTRQKQNMYNDTEFDSGRGDSGTKAFDLMFAGGSHDAGRMTTGMDFSDSALTATPATSKANYMAPDSSTAAEGAVFLKSDSWRSTDPRNTTASSRSTTSTAARIAALGPPPAIQPSSFNSFRGSQHVKTLFIDDLMGPLDASQLTTEVSDSVRESADAFHMNSPHSEWMSSAFYDDSDDDGSHSSIGTDLHDSKISMLGDDGGNASGSTDFYASNISMLGDDDDDFPRRKSERVETESVTKWKQKFYVEL